VPVTQVSGPGGYAGPVQSISFQNRRAGFLWGFAALWLAMLLAMTGVLLRDGPPEGYSVHATLAIGALFWMAGLGLLSFIAGKPCCQLSLQADGQVRLRWRYPFHLVDKTLPAASLLPAEVVETRDSEGDPYFLARVRSREGDVMDIAESILREECEQVSRELNARLPKPKPA
jgi:hypothetical protein